VRFSIFLCFFLRIRLRRFLMSDPMAGRTLLRSGGALFLEVLVAWLLDHVQLAIPAGAEEVCDEFYVGVLGFRALEKPPILAARGGRWYQRDEAVIHLGVDPTFLPATKAHPALVVDDYDDVLGRIEIANIQIRPDASIPGRRRCHVDDPVGNRIELIDAVSVA
jgi:catechol 2,3-dioxygenase-like lactoylglutathione lyase family enzyme